MSKFQFKTSAAAVAATLAAACWMPNASAASVDKTSFGAMSQQAKKNGAVPVVVNLLNVSLIEVSSDPLGVAARIAQKVRLLEAELGANYWQGSKHVSPLGQVALSLTDAGLRILAGGGNALSFVMGEPWQSRTTLWGLDGSLDEIERALSTQGFADVEVILNVDGLEFEQTSDGGVAFAMDKRAVSAATQQARALLESLQPTEVIGKQMSAAAFESMVGLAVSRFTPKVSLRITREGLERLINSGLVRALKVPGLANKQAKRVEVEAVATAAKYGFAEVTINLRNPLAGGPQSPASFAATARSNKRALDSVLAGAGVLSPLTDFSRLGAMAGRVTAAELRSLQNSADARLYSIEVNKAVASASLNTSTAETSTNMAHAWASGFRGANADGTTQNIVVLDTGVKTSHPFLQKSTGGSKVVFEACFGTNGIGQDGVAVYESVCPNQQGTTGDSPLDNVAGYAAPVANCTSPTGGKTGSCHHGTHVSGIAAGRTGVGTPVGVQGVANEADIVAVQVFSFDKARPRMAEPTLFSQDLEGSMAAVMNAMTPGTHNNPFTVNISAGGGQQVFSCPWLSTLTQNAVTTLYGLGVPVVASTGNQSSRSGINFPACLRNVIKVGALWNVGDGRTIAGTNLGDPLNYNGDYFWMAPGYGVTSSGNDAATPYLSLGGTSQASPHVAGLYALVKAAAPGIAVIDISRWIETRTPTLADPMNGAEDLPPVTILGRSVTFRRIHLKNF